MTQAVTCPRCRRHLPSAVPRCPHCATDLRPLVQLAALADRHFNDGVRAALAGRWNRAAEHVAVTLSLQPDDLDAVVLLAKIALRQGRRERSRRLWEQALGLAPHRDDIRAVVAQARRPTHPWRRLRDLAPSRDELRGAAPTRDEIAAALRWVARSIGEVSGRGRPVPPAHRTDPVADR